VPNLLYYGDNLEILRDHVASNSVDLVYLDPPFNSRTDYNVLFHEASGALSGLLGVKSTPFVMQIRDGQVRGKAFLHGVSDLERLVQASRRVESGQEAHAEVTGHAH